MSSFDWHRAIDLNRAALLRVVTVLFGLLSVGEAEGTVFLSPRAPRRLLRVLVPAETAMRRLIYICVRVFKIPSSKAATNRKYLLPDFASFSNVPENVSRIPAFKMADSIGWITMTPRTGSRAERAFDDEAALGPVSCTDLLRRVKAMEAALKDMRKASRRMAREVAKRAAAPLGPKCLPVLRKLPPGRRLNGRKEVDDILRECNGLACDVDRWPP
ncbi:MAG: hypothetical protein AAGG69_11405 [Pseudomonadota bacterium]